MVRVRLFNAPVPQQQTISEPSSFSGVGLHSGNKVNMTFLPAPPNTGIRFRRIDLDGNPEIPATVESVSDTTRSTTLSRGNIRLHTVEHVMASFRGCGIDNAIVELDANEPPIADGSARAYCRMIKNSGITLQVENRRSLVVTEPLSVSRDQSILSVLPYEGFRISCTSSDDQGRLTQFYSLDITPDSWEREISHARTFCFFEEIEQLIENGLIRGGSLENAVIIRDDAVLTNEPLRYREEFVRHKILDILGDLALAGHPIQAHVIAIRPCHRTNWELACKLARLSRKTAALVRLPTRLPKELAGPAAADIDRIMKILPHRYPFLMIDRILKIEETTITCLKNVTVNEPYFQGHFPEQPIMPGVLQLEAMAQAAGLLTLNKEEHWGKIAYFLSAENVKWRKPVRPGDALIVEIELIKFRGKVSKARGRCRVGEDTVSEAVVMFMLTDA